MSKTRILFVDFDGVLNSYQADVYWRKEKERRKEQFLLLNDDFCPIACSNLQYILENVPNLMIVVSSSWRHGAHVFGLPNDTVDDKLAFVQGVLKKNHIDTSRVIGITPGDDSRARGHNIQEWLVKNHGAVDPPGVEYAIVDDNDVIEDQEALHRLYDHVFKTTMSHGLTWDIANRIITHFNPLHRA